MQKKYFRQNLLKGPPLQSPILLVYIPALDLLCATQGPATSGCVMAVDFLCPPVTMSYEIMLVFSYHICTFALIP